MTSEESAQPQTEKMPAPGVVGQQLRKGREAAGLSIAQVAESQHLRPAVIQAIESGDYQQIESELFLKGYVRGYAGQVGLDPDRLLALLDEELEPLRRQREEAIESNPLHDIEKRKRQKKRIARGVAFVLLVLVVVAAGLYVYGERAGIDVFGTGQTASQAETEQTQSAPVTDAGQSPSSAGSDMTTPVLSSDTASAVAAQEPVGATTDGSIEQPVSPEVSGVAGSEPLPVDEGDQPVTESYDTTLPTQAVPEPAAIDDGVVRLKVSFSDKCWVQVSDGRGRTILASLETASDQVDVTGAPPLKVIFGATDAVATVEFEGQPVDMSQYRVVNNRAEFTLGQ